MEARVDKHWKETKKAEIIGIWGDDSAQSDIQSTDITFFKTST